MNGLGAYYAYNATREAVQPIADGSGEPLRTDGLGAYYAYDATHEAVQPVNGLALSGAAAWTDGELRRAIEKRAPVAVVRPWAAAVGDVGWKAPSAGGMFTLLPLTDRDLRAARSASGGHDVSLVGVFMPSRPSAIRAAQAFAGTPYELSEVLAVAPGFSTQPRPTVYFLVLGRFRDNPDDEEGGAEGVTAAARALGGKLVYPISLPLPRGARSLPPITMATPAPAAGAQQRPLVGPPPPVLPAVIRPKKDELAVKGVLGATPGGIALGVGLGAVALGAVAYFCTRST